MSARSRLQGATVYRVNGLIDDCARSVGEGKAKAAGSDTSTLKEPYRIEGKKTMGLELAEQLGWEVPDVIFYPTGRGTGLNRDVEGVSGTLKPSASSALSGRAWLRCRRRLARRLGGPMSRAPTARRITKSHDPPAARGSDAMWASGGPCS